MAKTKAGLKTSEYNLTHYVVMEEISISDLKDLGSAYELKTKKKGEHSSLQFHLIIDKKVIKDRKNRRMSFLGILHKDGSFTLDIQRTLSHKKIKIQEDGTYIISYTCENPKFKITHKIKSEYFKNKYLPKIEKLKKQRKERNQENKEKRRNSTMDKSDKSKSSPKNLVAKSDTEKKRNPVSSDQPKIKNAYPSSIRRCSNCSHFNQRRDTCIVLYMKVKPDNVCSRFYAPYYKVYYGGGFSPR